MNRLSIVLLSAMALMAPATLANAQDAFGGNTDPKIALPGLTEYALKQMLPETMPPSGEPSGWRQPSPRQASHSIMV